jgi:hypothetical protein
VCILDSGDYTSIGWQKGPGQLENQDAEKYNRKRIQKTKAFVKAPNE